MMMKERVSNTPLWSTHTYIDTFMMATTKYIHVYMACPKIVEIYYRLYS